MQCLKVEQHSLCKPMLKIAMSDFCTAGFTQSWNDPLIFVQGSVPSGNSAPSRGLWHIFLVQDQVLEDCRCDCKQASTNLQNLRRCGGFQNLHSLESQAAQKTPEARKARSRERIANSRWDDGKVTVKKANLSQEKQCQVVH